MTMESRLHDIYRMRDLSGRLLYIGVTNGGLRRFMEHAKDKTWWREVSTIDVEHLHCSRTVIEAVEREAIQSERPLYNVVHNRTAELPPPALSLYDLTDRLIEAGVDPHAQLPEAARQAMDAGIFANSSDMCRAMQKVKAASLEQQVDDLIEPPPAPPRDTLLMNSARIGQKVEHPAFGVGIVIDVSGRDEKQEIIIAFERAGTKHLAAAWAPLVLIEDDPFDFLVSPGGQW